jgi:hypothetical protein
VGEFYMQNKEDTMSYDIAIRLAGMKIACKKLPLTYLLSENDVNPKAELDNK